ncbi:ALP1-like protein isoform X1 [Tanacetum coccineum]
MYLCDSSNYSNMFDLDDIADINLVMQLINEGQQMQGESLRDSRKAINRERDMASSRDGQTIIGSWHIIAQPVCAWTVNKLRRIMYTCIILHNLILKNQKFALSDIGDTYICPRANLAWSWIERSEVKRKQAKELRDKQTHAKLQRNLIERVWQQHLLNE